MWSDTVVDVDMKKVFEGTREETLKWARENILFAPDTQIHAGDTMRVFTVPEYLRKYSWQYP